MCSVYFPLRSPGGCTTERRWLWTPYPRAVGRPSSCQAKIRIDHHVFISTYISRFLKWTVPQYIMFFWLKTNQQFLIAADALHFLFALFVLYLFVLALAKFN